MKDYATPERISTHGRLLPTARRVFLVAAIAALFACQQVRDERRGIRGEPAVAATVITIQTTIQPENRTFVRSLVIGDGRARSGNEVDEWRLFEFKEDRVTYVDDIAHTFSRRPMQSLLDDFTGAMAQPVPAGIPRATIVRTGAHRTIQGVDAEEIQVHAGSYVRQLWIANHPLIPPKLFSMMLASTPSPSPQLPMMKSVNEALLAINGFPLADHAELGFDTNKKLVVDNNVVRIERRNVPQSWLSVASTYRDVTPPAPAAKPQKRTARKR